jgi:hypothetical protein
MCTSDMHGQPTLPTPWLFSSQGPTAAAAEQRDMLQAIVVRLLATQAAVASSEELVTQLSGSIGAFANDTQAYQGAAATLAKAEALLGAGRSHMAKLQAQLAAHGVQWDASSGRITAIESPTGAQATTPSIC